jgi:hypothetical protein
MIYAKLTVEIEWIMTNQKKRIMERKDAWKMPTYMP